ncbi:Thioredoxin reductase [Microbacterium sp. 8M]|uniref:NAD(P)/FAD-dependent oxidoreductase n=1 Tax=Microbacterium sp. 8M TaxID=2653153 RepID=UPI0012F2AC51|nr:NAD(P)/FAD-dependent oxidoreductase [Microbacterium sp. 8M]VXB16326.1 Thioredoxin reductase [Microbacterium sp. 8M]
METVNSSASWDVIVIGGGAAGLSAALLLGRARRRTLVIDAGSPRNRFAAHMHGVLGNEGASPSGLLRRGREEVAGYGVETRDGAVAGVRDEGDVLVVAVDGAEERTRALVVASGIDDDLPAVAGLAERWGTSVLHCPYCHGWEVRDRRLAVLATSPASLHQAKMVRQWSDDVVLFSAGLGGLDPSDERLLRARGIEIVASPAVEVLGEGTTVSAIRTADGAEIPVDAVFTGGRPVPHDGFLDDLRLARADLPSGLGSFVQADATGRTSHPRIWAAGNVVNPMATVPMAIGAGAMAGAGVNGTLVEEDFRLVAGALSPAAR